MDEKPRVLMVDDEALFLESMAKVLGRQGMEVIAAPDGPSALRLLEERDADVVILDLKMPGMDGISTLQRMKAIRPLTPVIILTGHASLDAGLEALKLHAFDFQTKPAQVAWLVETIKEAIRSRRLAEEAASREG